MQMYTTAGAVSLSLWKDTSSLKGQPSWQPSWHPTSKLWTTISDHQPFCVLEIKWCRWWCRRSNNPETFDGSLLLSVRTFWTWVELSCHVRFSPTLVSPAGEWPRKVPSFPVGDSTTPPGNQDGLWNPWRLVWNRSTAAPDAPQHFSSSLFWVVDSYSLHFNFDVAAIDGKKARAK